MHVYVQTVQILLPHCEGKKIFNYSLNECHILQVDSDPLPRKAIPHLSTHLSVKVNK